MGSPLTLTEEEKWLFGFSNKRLTELLISNDAITLHYHIIDDFKRLVNALKDDGLEVKIISHWRSFEHQAAIWTAKWNGDRPLLGRDSQPIETSVLTDKEKFDALCYWSAVPGLSRHHWGTDFDIFLLSPITKGYQCRLTPDEFAKGGPCEALNSWLNDNLSAFNFFRPYQIFRGGVSPEPWHISHRKVAKPLIAQHQQSKIIDIIQSRGIPGASIIDNELDRYIEQYINNIDQ